MKQHVLTKYRKEHGIKQCVLAMRLGVSVATISRIEGGTQNVTPRLALKIERELDGVITRLDLLYPEKAGA